MPIVRRQTLLKSLKITSLLSPYEHCFIQSPQSWQAHFQARPWAHPPSSTASHQPLPPSFLTLPVEYLHSRSALSSCPVYTLSQPAHPGMYLQLLNLPPITYTTYSSLPDTPPHLYCTPRHPNHTGSYTPPTLDYVTTATNIQTTRYYT